MDLSQILNVILGGSLVGAIISIVTIRSALKGACGGREGSGRKRHGEDNEH